MKRLRLDRSERKTAITRANGAPLRPFDFGPPCEFCAHKKQEHPNTGHCQKKWCDCDHYRRPKKVTV